MEKLELYLLIFVLGFYPISGQETFPQIKQAHMILFNVLEDTLNLSIVQEEFSVRSLVDCVQSCFSKGYCYSIYFTTQSKLCQLTNDSLPPSLENVNGSVTYADFGPGGRYLVKVGDRVTRGPTWIWGDEDGPGYLGTVTGHSFGIWWWVLWDNMESWDYRMGDGFQDLLVVG